MRTETADCIVTYRRRGPKEKQAFARALRAWLEEKKMKPSAFARVVGVSPDTVTVWLNALTLPHPLIRDKFEGITGINPLNPNTVIDL